MSATAPLENSSVTTGDVLAGRYQVTRVIGRGGMGVVVEARHLELGERVAVKVLHPRYCENQEAMARFQHEARAAVRIHSEHSVRLIDVGTTAFGAPFLVMELLEGADLANILRNGAMPIEQAVLLILQACEGMAEVHRNGIIHRDLKPGNLYVTRRPDGSPLVKVLDFGIAKSMLPLDATEQSMTMTLVALGTPLYMSPEQVRCSKYVDGRTDVWSLGAILYELLAGRPAFGGNTVANITAQVLEANPDPLARYRGDVPPELDRAVRKALAKKPEHRFMDVAALACALAPFAGDAGRLHAERATRILRGDGAASMPSLTPDLAALGSTTLMESEVVTTHVFAHRRRARMLAAGLSALAVMALGTTYMAIDAWRARSAVSSALRAQSGVASAGQVRGAIAATAARMAARADGETPTVRVDELPAAQPAAAQAPPKAKAGATSPAARPRPKAEADVGVLETRK